MTSVLDARLSADDCFHAPAGEDTGDGSLQRAIVPEGYLLTTRFLRYEDPDDVEYGCGTRPHAHPAHVVFWPDQGSAAVEIEGRHWSLVLGQGVWVPAGTVHSVSSEASRSLAALHILPSAWLGESHGVRAVSVNAALRELLVHLAYNGMPRDQRLRAQQVCMELIADQHDPMIELPLPRDARILRITRAIMTDPADDRSIEDWAWLTSTSARTLARAFRAETGMTFTQWRTFARMSAAMRLLGEGAPVGVVARRVGYATISAFSAAFHRTMGRPPHQFLPAQRA